MAVAPNIDHYPCVYYYAILVCYYCYVWSYKEYIEQTFQNVNVKDYVSSGAPFLVILPTLTPPPEYN